MAVPSRKRTCDAIEIRNNVRFLPGTATNRFQNPENHVDNECLVIGFLTKQTISWLLREGNISPHQHATFFRAVKAFLFGLWSICGSAALKKMSY